jgi:MFS family permease
MNPSANNLQSAPREGLNLLLDKLAGFEMPSQTEYVRALETMDVVLAVALFIFGLVYLLQGWKVFKMLVIVNAALLGGVFGVRFGQMLQGGNTPLFVGIAGLLLCATLAWPLMKFAVSLMGGLAGCFLGYGMWVYVTETTNRTNLVEHAWAGALLGLVALGLLTFVMFQIVIMVFTSMQGSLMVMTGLMAMLMHVPSVHHELADPLSSSRHLLVLVIGVPAIIGFCFQYVAMDKKKKKKGGGGGD